MARKEQGRIPKRILRGGPARESFELNGRAYRLDKVLKHDFFAVTGRYAGPDGRRVVLKHYHTEPWLGWPLDWAGRLMADREVRNQAEQAGTPASFASAAPVNCSSARQRYARCRPGNYSERTNSTRWLISSRVSEPISPRSLPCLPLMINSSIVV